MTFHLLDGMQIKVGTGFLIRADLFDVLSGKWGARLNL